MLDLSQITKVKTSSLDEIDQLNIYEIGDSLSNLTAKRMSPMDKAMVYKTVRELEKYTKVSFELLRYLIATCSSEHREVVNLIGSNQLKKITRSKMNKIKRILKDRCEIKIVRSNSYFKKLVCLKGSLGFVNTKKTFHFIKFKEKNLEKS